VYVCELIYERRMGVSHPIYLLSIYCISMDRIRMACERNSAKHTNKYVSIP